MCCCPAPNVNGTEGYSWDGKVVSTRPVAPPELEERDTLLFDEPGRCGGMDSHCHHYRLVNNCGHQLLVRHGGGTERIRISLPRGFNFSAMDSDTRYWILNAIHHANREGEQRGVDSTARKYTKAFVDGRLKKRRHPAKGIVKVWIETALGGI